LNEAEAQALNQLLAENIRNNVYPSVSKKMETASREAFVECQQAIGEYAKRYKFKTRAMVEPKMSPMEQELRAVAREALAGLEWHQIEDQIDELMGTEQVWEEAKRRLNVLKNVAGQFEFDL
jgi:thioesterase domain-containing protein